MCAHYIWLGEEKIHMLMWPGKEKTHVLIGLGKEKRINHPINVKS